MEHSYGGPLGTLIAGLGMGAYYVGLTWINMLLGILLTPFFIQLVVDEAIGQGDASLLTIRGGKDHLTSLNPLRAYSMQQG